MKNIVNPLLFKQLLLAAAILAGGLLAGQVIAPPPAAAQGGEACPSFVQQALTSLDANCGSLDRDTACYGNSRVDSEFWMARDELVFSTPADRVPLIDLRTISTTPLDVQQQEWGVAVMHLQADLPDSLPGQAVTFLLMGDASLQNAVTPEQAAARPVVDPVPALTVFPANLRSRPSTNANIITSLSPGSALQLVGVNETGDWYEVRTSVGGNGWIFNELISIDDTARLADLPVTYGPNAAPRYGPMQAFYLSNSFGAPTCNEAPNALVVESTDLAEVALNVNQLEIHIGSTVIIFELHVPGLDQPVLLMALIDGHLRTTVGQVPIFLNNPGQVIAVTLTGYEGVDGESFDGVDGESRLLNLRHLDLGPLLQNICRTAQISGLLAGLPADLCEHLTPFFFVPPPYQPPGSDEADATEEPVLGGWGECGSCDYCGPYAQAECVQSPTGECLWDPATCGYHGPTGDGSLQVVSSSCYKNSTGSAVLSYSAEDGATVTSASASSSNGAAVGIGGTSFSGHTINVSFSCGPFMGMTANVTVSVGDSSGRGVSTTFPVTVN